MGFDLYGISPVIDRPEPIREDYDDTEKFYEDLGKYHKNNPGVYFRANVWYWRPLWTYVIQVCDHILSEEDIEGGDYNGGYVIDKEKCSKMALQLSIELACGSTRKYAELYKEEQDSTPDEECYLCKGTGQRSDAYVDGECNGCRGKGTRRPFSTQYPFNVETVEDFVEFVRNSGGFQIC